MAEPMRNPYVGEGYAKKGGQNPPMGDYRPPAPSALRPPNVEIPESWRGGAADAPEPSDARTPERIALDLLARLKRAEENGKALRDVVASIAERGGSADTIRAVCRLLVRAYDEGMSDAR